MEMQLKDMQTGDSGRILGFDPADRPLRYKLLAMGLTPGAEFKVVRVEPRGVVHGSLGQHPGLSELDVVLSTGDLQSASGEFDDLVGRNRADRLRDCAEFSSLGQTTHRDKLNG